MPINEREIMYINVSEVGCVYVCVCVRERGCVCVGLCLCVCLCVCEGGYVC